MQSEPTGQTVAQTAKPAAQYTAKPTGKTDVDAGVNKQAFNQAILESSMNASISSGNHSMSLLFKSALEHINVALAPELGENAIQNLAKSDIDVSPQATADRIVSMSTAFFSQYAEQHPEKDLETSLKDFTDIISGGIDQGFSEAREVLDGLQVLEGDIATNIDKTYDLVQSGLKSFIDNYPRPE
ncbi:MAG: DUF5610 domain-containing protein [Methylococcales bacterium]|jgi:hypothetical protein|nr:DUF5610 domain-containing protein [Methylococcales bacterium]MBT7443808.1 DUF5610 domain-containing protein [Methylococcales bacterium]